VESVAVNADSELLVRNEEHVRVFTLNRPERSNALSRGLIGALIDALIEADEDGAVWVLVLTGAGSRTFSAGADLKEMREKDVAGVPFRPPMKRPDRSVFEVLQELDKPTIAAINGHAVAGGLELALACDLRIASTEAKIGMPEAKRGMGALYASVVLPRLVPPPIALELLFTGDYISAHEAERWGLVNHVVAPEQVMPEAMALAQKIAANAPLSVRKMKATVRAGLSLPVSAALRLEVGPDPYRSADRQEGIRAFAEKRAPEWRGE
jgi:enoyl-CoA hydratase